MKKNEMSGHMALMGGDGKRVWGTEERKIIWKTQEMTLDQNSYR
jgi:hypothetical protein